MSFDQDVDALKTNLAKGGDDERAGRYRALKSLLDCLTARIDSRRIDFALDELDGADDEPGLTIVHAETGDDLGAIYVEDGQFSFETEDDEYFPNIGPEGDAAGFVETLYEALKTGLATFEFDLENAE